MARLFVVVTQDTSGLGWTKKLQEEGEQVVFAKAPGPKEDRLDLFDLVGRGLIDCEPLEVALKSRLGPATYWLFERNIQSAVADWLRGAGQHVFGTSVLSERMENDRAFTVDLAARMGLPSPPTFAFDRVDAGVAFVEQHPTTAYVLKPNASDAAFSTFVPFREEVEDANHELLCYLRNQPEMASGYVLQERKPGVEVNVEVWFHDGAPFMAVCNLENKRKWDHDLGEMSGCAGDIAFVVPLDSPLVLRTIGRMFPFYWQRNYSGFADVNVIVGDNATWFLEVCNRFGYNAHPNLFLTCALGRFGDTMVDWMEGESDKIAAIPSRFRAGFGASITLFIDHPRAGLPLHINPRAAPQFYAFEGYKSGADLLLAGYSNEIGIFTDHDYTIEEAAEGCLNKLLFNEAISFPDMAFRTDLHRDNYRGAPLRRYSALKSMRLL